MITAIMLVLSTLAGRLFGPNPPIIVDAETTYITSPRTPNGKPDYVRFVRDRCRRGVTPANNAATLLLPTLGREGYSDAEFGLVCQELEIAPGESRTDALVSIDCAENQRRIRHWLEQSNSASPTDEDVLDVIKRASQRRWMPRMSSALEPWVRANHDAFERLVAAAGRPRCYFPSPTLLKDPPGLLLEMSLAHGTNLRTAARSLCARAMWQLSEKRPTEAWRDLLAVHRLARLIAQGRTLVEKLIGFSLQRNAEEATLALLQYEHLTPALARQIQSDIDALPPFGGMADCLSCEERALLLDAIASNSEQGLYLLRHFGGPNGEKIWADYLMEVVSVDWNYSLRKLNRWVDRLSEAAHLINAQHRHEQLDQFEDDLFEHEAHCRQSIPFFSGWFSRYQRSAWAGDVMVSLMMPALNVTIQAEDRTNSELLLIKLAAALAVFRAEQGAYPNTLADLSPKVVAQLPDDLFGRPHRYRRDGPGYLLLSLGRNGRNDGGSNEVFDTLNGQPIELMADADAAQAKIPDGADDISIRIPRPALEIPSVSLPGGQDP